MFNSVTNTAALAAEANLDTLGEKAMFALENSVLGILIVFAVLALLCLIVRLVASILTPKEKKKPAEKAVAPAPSPTPAPTPTPATNDGEIVAAITAAIALMLESEGKDPKGFRVVSFRRSSTRKNSL